MNTGHFMIVLYLKMSTINKIYYGLIDGYYCNQDELKYSVVKLFDLLKFGGDIIGQADPPEQLTYKDK